MLRVMILGLCLCTFSVVAQSEDFNGPGRAFLGVSLLGMNLEYQETQPVFKQKNKMNGLYIYTGADFNEFFGFETRFGFTNTDVTNYANGSVGFSVDVFQSYLFRFNWDIDSHWKTTALLGYTDAQVSRKTSVVGGNSKASARGISYGAIVSYAMTQNVSVEAEWVSYWSNVDTSVGTTTSFNNLALRLGYHF